MEAMTQTMLTVHRLKRAYSKRFEHLYARADLTPPQVNVLLFLGNNPAFDTARDIAELRGLAKSHVSKSVEELTAKGLLEGVQEQTDRRRIHLRLTPRALPLLQDAQTVQQEFFKGVYAGFSTEERAQIDMFLKRMAENIAVLNKS